MAKIDDKIALTEHKFEEIKAKFEDDKISLANLINQRAKLEAEVVLENKQDGKKIAEIDKQRDKLHSQIEIYPSLIKEIESKLEALKKEKEEMILRENLTKQKGTAREIEKLSQELVSSLEKANEINNELQKQHRQYVELHKVTGQNVFKKHTTGGSRGSLDHLLGILKMEVEEGKPRKSPRFYPPGPPI